MEPAPAPTNPLDGLLCLQVWEHADREAVAAFAKTAGMNAVVWKVLDGETWMGAIDPQGMKDAAAVADFAAYFHGQGLKFGVWTVPHGDLDTALQADLTAEAANAGADFLFIDAEPFAGFWGVQDAHEATGFMTDVRRLCHVPILLQPDPRPHNLAALKIEEWMPYVDGVCPQNYWTDFQQAWADSMFMLDAATRWGVPVYPTLPGDSTVADMVAASAFCKAQGASGIVVWRYGHCAPEVAGAAVQGFTNGGID